MHAFFDTSAILPLLLEEPMSTASQRALQSTERLFAWNWMRVEVEAGLIRRKAKAEVWSEWRSLSARVFWLELGSGQFEPLCSFNRCLGLRAADAAHLFVYERGSHALPELALVTFDREMEQAAAALGFRLWQPDA